MTEKLIHLEFLKSLICLIQINFRNKFRPFLGLYAKISIIRPQIQVRYVYTLQEKRSTIFNQNGGTLIVYIQFRK